MQAFFCSNQNLIFSEPPKQNKSKINKWIRSTNSITPSARLDAMLKIKTVPSSHHHHPLDIVRHTYGAKRTGNTAPGTYIPTEPPPHAGAGGLGLGWVEIGVSCGRLHTHDPRREGSQRPREMTGRKVQKKHGPYSRSRYQTQFRTSLRSPVAVKFYNFPTCNRAPTHR